jgi:hypothetical protein
MKSSFRISTQKPAISRYISPFSFSPQHNIKSVALKRAIPYLFTIHINSTALVFRSDNPGKAAQWLARSIREILRDVVISHSFAFSASRRLKLL